MVLVFLAFASQLFGFVERYGNPATTVRMNKENQRVAGLQNFLLTLQQGSEKEGEFRHPPLVRSWTKRGCGTYICVGKGRGRTEG